MESFPIIITMYVIAAGYFRANKHYSYSAVSTILAMLYFVGYLLVYK